MESQNRHILIVDDNTKNLQVIAKVLKDEGFLISLAQDGKTALSLLGNQIPDLILMDIMMPEMDGIELCRLIKQNQKLKEIPVIFLTAKSETADLVEGFEAGGVDYITKPFNQSELLVRVKNHLELALSRKKIIELNQTRDKLYSIIAHDIRSPLNSITQILSAIDSGYINSSHHNFDEIFGELGRMTRDTSNLLNNLLEWTKSQGGSIALSPKKNRIYPILLECAQLLNTNAKSKDITIQIDVPESAEAYFDLITIHTVFRNLLSNAIKFTPEKGKIFLTSETKGNMLVVNVIDSGVGMSTETIDLIFNKKEHYTSLGTKNEKGTGLGLIVIKEFIEKNNGLLEVISKECEGTVFSVSIPLNEQ